MNLCFRLAAMSLPLSFSTACHAIVLESIELTPNPLNIRCGESGFATLRVTGREAAPETPVLIGWLAVGDLPGPDVPLMNRPQYEAGESSIIGRFTLTISISFECTSDCKVKIRFWGNGKTVPSGSTVFVNATVPNTNPPVGGPSNGIVVNCIPVPEMESGGIMALGGLLLLCRRRKVPT